MKTRWQKIQSILADSLKISQMDVWISPLLAREVEETLVLLARNRFVADELNRQYRTLIERAARTINPPFTTVEIHSRDHADMEQPEDGFSKGQASISTGSSLFSKMPFPPSEEISDASQHVTSQLASGFDHMREDSLFEPFAQEMSCQETFPAQPGQLNASSAVDHFPAPDSGAGHASGSFGSSEAAQSASALRAHPGIRKAGHGPERPSPRPLSALQLSLPMPMRQESEGPETVNHNWRYSFEDFVVGPSNELAYAASHNMCMENAAADVLYLASPPGLGKTHLMQAVGSMLTNMCNRKTPRVEYLTAEEFVSRFWLSIKGNDTDSFKARYRGADLLLLEDVHFLQGKGNMQAELLATLKSLQERGSKVVFTSSFAPRDLRQVDEQLYSRLTAGLFSYIDRPDEDTRRRILRKKATMHQVSLPEDVETLLARHINADVRQIESCLRNLILKAKLYNSGITTQMAWEVIGNYISHTPHLTIDQIVEQVCKSFGLTSDQLYSSRRRQELVNARNTAFYLARKHTDMSLESIGKRFNRRHSTVIKGITSLEREISRQSTSGRQIANAIALIERNATPAIV